MEPLWRCLWPIVYPRTVRSTLCLIFIRHQCCRLVQSIPTVAGVVLVEVSSVSQFQINVWKYFRMGCFILHFSISYFFPHPDLAKSNSSSCRLDKSQLPTPTATRIWRGQIRWAHLPIPNLPPLKYLRVVLRGRRVWWPVCECSPASWVSLSWLCSCLLLELSINFMNRVILRHLGGWFIMQLMLW